MMKKIFILMLCGVLLLIAAQLFSQNASTTTQERDIYSKTFPITKIFSHRYGYLVIYLTPKMDSVKLYVSMDLFTGSNGKARLVYGRGPEFPYLSVTWIDGQIDHISIFAVEDMNHLSWGVMHGGDEVQSQFQTELAITF
jgi:hypothetical protein